MIEIIVFEQRGVWAAALRLALADSLIKIGEVRSQVECQQRLRHAGRALVVVELTHRNGINVAPWLSQLTSIAPRAHIAIVAQRGLELLEPTIRSWGAIYMTNSPRQLKPLVTVIRRLNQQATLETPQNLRADIWQRLPWPGVAGKA